MRLSRSLPIVIILPHFTASFRLQKGQSFGRIGMSHYLHHVPGRLRVKAAALKNNAGKAVQAGALLEDIPGIEAVEVNAVTGSMLVRYDEDIITSAQILGVLVAYGFINLLPGAKSKGMPSALKRPAREEVVQNLSGVLPKLLADIVIDKVVQRAMAALVSAAI